MEESVMEESTVEENRKDSGTLGNKLRTARSERGLSREEVSEGILEAEELRGLEEGGEWNFWQVRLLTGRLHIPDSEIIFYLDEEENILVNLEMDIRCDIRFWRYEKAEKRLKCFYELCNRENRFPMRIYHSLYAVLKVRQKRETEEERKRFREFMEQEMPDFERRLLANKLHSPDELSVIAAYYRLTEKNTAQRLKKLYYIVHYFREEFSKEEERLQPFYAELMLACAQCQYELGDYVNCIAQCEEGIKVTRRSRICEAGGELYEWMADAKSRILEEEIQTEQKMQYPETDTGENVPERKKEVFAKNAGKQLIRTDEEMEMQIREILGDYMIADALYRCFYFEYQNGYHEKLHRKVERWKTIIQQK